LKATEFVETDNHLDALAEANEIFIDDPRIEAHEATTNEVRECCKDIKVLGRKELRELLNWRKKLRQYFQALNAEALKETATEETEELSPEALEEQEEQALDEEVKTAEHEEKSTKKRKRKKEMKEKRKKKQQLDLKMVIPGDKPDNPVDQDLFSLERMKNKMKQIEAEAPSNVSDDSGDESEDVSLPDEEHGQLEDETVERNPLLVNFDDDEDDSKEKKDERRTQSWFQKDIFADLENDEDEDDEIERMANKYRKEHGIASNKDEDKQENNEAVDGLEENEEEMEVPTEPEVQQSSVFDKEEEASEADDHEEAEKDPKKGKQTKKERSAQCGIVGIG